MKNRLARVCEVIKRELGDLFHRELDFEGALVTISSVDITPDLKQAHVFISALGTKGQQRASMQKLEKNRVLLQSGLAKRIKIKHTPQLHFRIDEAMERGSRVLNIMNELGLPEENENADDQL